MRYSVDLDQLAPLNLRIKFFIYFDMELLHNLSCKSPNFKLKLIAPTMIKSLLCGQHG